MDSDENEQFSDENTQNSLDEEVTGLRSKRLFAMIVCLFILFLLTFFILILNIMIITTLRMDPSGIKFLRFHHSLNEKTRQLEKTVEMAGEKITFDRVVSDKVVGFPAKDITIEAPRMKISAKPNDSLLTIGDKFCRFEQVNNFQVLSSLNDKTMFSARHPRVSIDKRIKKLAAEKIITNKIRSAVDESLKIDGENVILRGNEQVRIDARNVNFDGMHRMVFNISRDGVMHMRGRVRLGDGATSLPMSTSPSLSASLDGMRLCACAQYTHKLFVVPANKHSALNMMAKMGVTDFGLFSITIVEIGDKKFWVIDPPETYLAQTINIYDTKFYRFLRLANISTTPQGVREMLSSAADFQLSLSDGFGNSSEPIDVEELSLAVPEINFKEMFRQILDDPRIDNHIKTYRYDLFFENELSNALQNTPEQTVIDLLTWAVFRKMEDVINERLDCAEVIVKRMPRASRRYFTRNYFKKENREAMSELIEDVRKSYIDIFKKNTWMENSTREAAIEKVEQMGKIVGYGDEYEPEGTLDKMYEEYMSSGVLNQSYFSAMRKLAETHALHFTEYVLSNHTFNIASNIFTTNAFYYPSTNKFSVLIPEFDDPFFDASFPKYAQIGGLGRTVGHEIGHAFDNNGMYYDKDGIRKNWWTRDGDGRKYSLKMNCLMHQYFEFEDPDYGKEMNGLFCLDENIADLLGMQAAWNAHRKLDGSNQPKLFGFENYPVDKLFWQIGALGWCEHRYDPEAVRNHILNDGHPVKKFRVNGVYQNMPGFAETFNCPVGSPMNPEKKCELF